ncbi:MAG: hypothetical protein J6Y79_04125 [Paludibacteraceae bacterium]|nr:hypothetical protein [Paludibacteraceae bacterium]
MKKMKGLYIAMLSGLISFGIASCGPENDSYKIQKIRERFSYMALDACSDDTLTEAESEVLLNQTLPVMKLRYQYREDTASLAALMREVQKNETNRQRENYREAEVVLRETPGVFFQGYVWNAAMEYARTEQGK